MQRQTDAYNALRRRVLPGIHSALDVLIGGYALSDTPPEEYVATLECPKSRVESLLESLGFSRNLVASLKIRVDGNVSDGSWVYRESLLADHQLHAILHGTEDGVETYAHLEYSSIRHPYRHYLARGYDAEAGVQQMRSVLMKAAAERGISRTIRSPHRRQTWYISLLRMVSARLARRVAGVTGRFRGGLQPETPGLAQLVAGAVRSVVPSPPTSPLEMVRFAGPSRP